MPSLDSLKCRRSLEVAGKTYHYYSLPEAAAQLGDISRLPTSLKVLLENLLRWEDGETVRGEDLQSLARCRLLLAALFLLRERVPDGVLFF